MKINPLRELEALGQSIWLDYIERELISSGKLQQLIDEEGLVGMTSNPTLFDQAIAKSNAYDQDIATLVKADKTIDAIYEALTQKDVQDAADRFRPIYDKTEGKDGYVSLEVNPHLAHDTEGTIAEGKRLWKALNRPNVFIKVPATIEGLPAIKQLITAGINVNVTLLFGLPRYREVAEAYIGGLEARAVTGAPIKHVACVASFFLSRIDVLIDPMLEKIIPQNNAQSALAKKMQGQIAIASAQLAYEIYQELFHSDRFKNLAEKGARVQRLLWASTGTKNPAYSDVKYVDALIGPDTVNTLPLETLHAYRDHGEPALRLTREVDRADAIFQQLPMLDIIIDKLTVQLEDEGVDKFIQSFDQLINTLQQKSLKYLRK